MTIWSKANLTDADRELLAQTQREAGEQRKEALTLLAGAQRAAAILRESQQKNHYREALDLVLGGERRRGKK